MSGSPEGRSTDALGSLSGCSWGTLGRTTLLDDVVGGEAQLHVALAGQRQPGRQGPAASARGEECEEAALAAPVWAKQRVDRRAELDALPAAADDHARSAARELAPHAHGR